MKNRNIIKLFTFLWSALLIVSCSNEDLDRKDGPTVPEGIPVTLTLNVGTPDVSVVETKALENDDKTFGIIKDLAVIVYDEKGKNPEITYTVLGTPATSVKDIHFNAKTGKRKIYVLANVGSIENAKAYTTEEDLLAKTVTATINPTGNEMMLGCVEANTASGDVIQASSDAYYGGKASTIDIQDQKNFSARVIPPYSKITFKITKDLPDMDKTYLNIHSVKICKLPKVYTLRSLSGESTDKLSTAQISDEYILANLKEVQDEGYSFYMYENKQGIYPQDKGAAYKSPGIGVPEFSTGIDYETWFKKWDDLACTYIEVEGKYSLVTGTNTVKVGDIHYRFFLGENATDNFNIQRNIHYIVSLNFTQKAGYEELEHEWRVHAKLDEATFIPEGDLVIDGYPQGIGFVPFYVANATAGTVQVTTSSTSNSEMMMYFYQQDNWGTSSAADFKNFGVAPNSISEYAVAPNDGGILGSRAYDDGEYKVKESVNYDQNLSMRGMVGSGEIYNMRKYTITYTPTSTPNTETSDLIVKELPLLLIAGTGDPAKKNTVYARRVDGAYLHKNIVEGGYSDGGRNQYFTRTDSKDKARRICTADPNLSYPNSSISIGLLYSFLPTVKELKSIIEYEMYSPLKKGSYWTMDGLYNVATKELVKTNTGEGYIRCVARVQ